MMIIKPPVQYDNLSRKVQDIKDSIVMSQLVSNYIQLKSDGKDLKGLCPFHKETTPSFTVFDRTQSFYCFGCAASGDVIDFVCKQHGLSFRQAIEYFGGQFLEPSKAHNIPIAKPAARLDSDYIKTPEIDFNKIFSNKLKKYVKANNDLYYRYDYGDSKPAGYIIRTIDKKGKKQFYPIGLFEHPDDGLVWAYGGLSNPRPLYNLPEILKEQDKPVLIVEGEKCAEAAKKLLKKFVVTTWVGGAKAVGQTDWGILEDREVFIWPDNDPGGIEAAKEISSMLMNIETIKIKKEWSEKWDIADEIEIGATEKELTNYILKFRRPRPKNINNIIEDHDNVIPPGLLGELTKFILAASIKPRPILATGAAIAIMAILQAQKVCTEDRIHPNLYIVTLGTTSCGKNGPLLMITNILHELGCGDLMASAFASGAGLVGALHKRKGRLICTIDEFGEYMSGVTDRNATSSKKDIIGKLLKMYSNASTYYNDDEYTLHGKKDPPPMIVISKPNLVLYGTSVPDNFYKALKASDSTNGFLSRMIVLNSPDFYVRPRNYNEIAEYLPTELKESLLVWAARPSNLYGSEVFDEYDTNATKIPFEVDARELIHKFRDECADISIEADASDDHFRCSLYHRAFENASKLALLARANSLSIDYQATKWAVELTKKSIQEFYMHGLDYLNDTPFAEKCKELLRYFKTVEVWVSFPTLCNKFVMPTKSLKEILEYLTESGQIESKEFNPKHHSKFIRKSTVFRYPEKD